MANVVAHLADVQQQQRRNAAAELPASLAGDGASSDSEESGSVDCCDLEEGELTEVSEGDDGILGCNHELLDNLDGWIKALRSIHTSPDKEARLLGIQALGYSLAGPLGCTVVWMWLSYSFVDLGDPFNKENWWLCMAVCAIKWCFATAVLMTWNLASFVGISIRAWHVCVTWVAGSAAMVSVWWPRVFGGGHHHEYWPMPFCGILAAGAACVAMAAGAAASAATQASASKKAQSDLLRVTVFNGLLYVMPACYVLLVAAADFFCRDRPRAWPAALLSFVALKLVLRQATAGLLQGVGSDNSPFFLGSIWLCATHSISLTVFLGISSSWRMVIGTTLLELAINTLKIHEASWGRHQAKKLMARCRGVQPAAADHESLLRHQVKRYTALAVEEVSEVVLPLCFMAAALVVTQTVNSKHFLLGPGSLEKRDESSGCYIYRLAINIGARLLGEITSLALTMHGCRYLGLYPFSHYLELLRDHRWHVCFTQCWVVDTVFCSALVACSPNFYNEA